MKRFLTDEQRSEALQNDAGRREAALKQRLADPLVRDIILRPAPGQLHSNYELQDLRLAS